MFKKKKTKVVEKLTPLEQRISYVVNGLYGNEVDKDGNFICANKLNSK